MPLGQFRIAARRFARSDTDQAVGLDQDVVGRKGGDCAAGKADDKIATVPGNRPGRGQRQITADRIKDQIDAASPCQILDFGGQIWVGRIKQIVGPGLINGLQLFLV